MDWLCTEIADFLSEEGFHFHDGIPEGMHTRVIRTEMPARWILPVGISAVTPEEAAIDAEETARTVEAIKERTGSRPLIIAEDRWRSRNGMMKERLLAHLGRHSQIYARNCEVRRIEKAEAAAFLRMTHSYGDAACRYRYGLFLKRHTGHLAAETSCVPGQLVAVATFSNARRWIKGDKTIRSYEWTRYASLSGIRVNGGMGKLLKTFIQEAKPDDIMSYADLEWSEGSVYEQLGFVMEGMKSPVCFEISPKTWERSACQDSASGNGMFFMNYGSAKYRMKLTEYE